MLLGHDAFSAGRRLSASSLAARPSVR